MRFDVIGQIEAIKVVANVTWISMSTQKRQFDVCVDSIIAASLSWSIFRQRWSGP